MCSIIIIQGITILAPVTSPNTDGINPGLIFFIKSTDFRLFPCLHDECNTKVLALDHKILAQTQGLSTPTLSLEMIA
ncbi:hypothetical protein ACS0TY_029207 [Phlomoides rotata]